MAFPASILDLKVSLDLAGTWTDISSYAYQRANPGVTITRGRPDEVTQAAASSAAMIWNNRDGRFSPRNPVGAYYGNLGRNTPVRVSVPDSGTYLRIEDDQTSYISTPDSVGLSVTGDLELQLDLQLSTYVAAVLASKDDASAQRSWSIRLNGDGTVAFYSYDSGSVAHLTTSTLPLPLGRIALKVTLAVATGTVTFYTAPTIAGSWTQLGSAVTGGATSVFDSTTAISVGYNAAITALGSGFAGPAGQFYGFKILAGIGGAAVGSPDFTAATPGNATLTDAQGNVWTLAGTAEFSNRAYRFHGECADLPQRWDSTGKDVWTPVTAAGLLRRIGAGKAPVPSAIKRAILAASGLVAYWPCEDGSNSTSIGSAISGAPAMGVTGAATFASDSGFQCSNALPSVNSSAWNGRVPRYTSSGPVVVRFLLHITSGSAPPDGTVLMVVNTTGAWATLRLTYHTGGNLQLVALDSTGATALDTGSVAVGADGALLWVSIEARTITGPFSALQLVWNTVGSAATSSGSAHGAVVSYGSVLNVQVNPAKAGGTYTVGHISVQDSWTDLSTYQNPLNAWLGETAGNRFSRLCSENSLACRVYGYPSKSVAMGYQTADTLLNLFQQVEDADRGMIFEARSGLAVGYRTSASLTAQAAAVTLDYSAATLGTGSGDTGLEPTDDDQFTRNDVTITRINGASATSTLADGSAMSTGSPPNGVGDYPFSASVSLQLDSDAADVAGWIRHLGTVNEERYPGIPLNLARSALASQFYTIQNVNLGDYVAVSSPPAWLPPDSIKALVWGYVERLGGYTYTITWQTTPESPYETLVADGTCRADTDGSTLHANITSAATSMSVDTAAGNALWTTAAGDLPFDVLMGGERITVTNITGASSPQTFTIVRSVNGVVKAQTAGTALSLFQPCYAALA